MRTVKKVQSDFGILLGILGLHFAVVACTPYKAEKVKKEETGLVTSEAENKLNPDPIRKNLARTLKIMDQGSQIFAEGWMVLFGNQNQPPPSIFKVLGQYFKKHLTADLKVKETSDDCPKDFTSLEFTWRTKPKKELTKIKIYKNQCLEGQKWELAEILISNSQNMTLKVWTNNFREAVGDGLSIMGKPITCEIQADELSRLQLLNCQELGQNRERMIHVLFHEFKYIRSHNELLSIKADQYQNLSDRLKCDSRDACLTLLVPLVGKIQITDNRVNEKEEKEQLLRAQNFAPRQIVAKTIVIEAQRVAGSAESVKDGEGSRENSNTIANDEINVGQKPIQNSRIASNVAQVTAQGDSTNDETNSQNREKTNPNLAEEIQQGGEQKIQTNLVGDQEQIQEGLTREIGENKAFEEERRISQKENE